ncbi:right-handed parallel beta-helix repeat-containing protein [Pontiella sulfatireligans]|uniref:Right handed beta helix domain-containing protein n=1 Tax=Pontiella sulfatireligans TaxID=2750658 RepID=A0A6C2US58_9BACT|nr:right-handed parallel beta-helix repeat-containing protein [Pontiella sulfatireligans]VGO23145.1 hypothetical protein SCARR_05250 [Pontiella sulfatireligans]
MRVLLFIIFVATVCARGAEYTVDSGGNDNHPGTPGKPFRTISKAASLMQAGDTCRILPGTYRESVALRASGTVDLPIRFVGAVNADGSPAVRIDGTDKLDAAWKVVAVNGVRAFAAPLSRPTSQLFSNDRMMTEARWPDQRFNQIWDRSTWAKSAKGSRKDLMICEELAETGVDWTGAIATLNVAHQFKTWTRSVLEHRKGSPEFNYELGERLNSGADEGHTWWDDRFYLSGKIEALTSPEEWFYDDAKGRLLFIPPDGRAPKKGEVAVKTRDFGFSGTNLEHVEISGIGFFGCTFAFRNSNHLTVENSRVLYPNYARILNGPLLEVENSDVAQTYVIGDSNTVRKVSVAYGNTGGIKMTGSGNLIENCIVHDVCWGGGLSYPSVMIHSSNRQPGDSTVARCTIFNCGNLGIRFMHQNNLIEYNRVYNTGLACKDISAIHTGSPACAGSIARYNWVHDSRGKGMRGDDQTRGLTFHHNVIWNCDEGMIVKGDFNTCYNNTILGSDGHGCLIIPTRPEPRKWWAKNKFLDVQNLNSVFCSNLVETISYRYDPLPGDQVHSNVEFAGLPFKDRLISFGGARSFNPEWIKELDSNIGAYESGVEPWRAGADWQAPSIGIELSINAEVARGWRLDAPQRAPVVRLSAKLLNSKLSAVSLNKLQQLYSECWTPKEAATRKTAIRKRGEYEAGSAEYKALHAQVVGLHRAANECLQERAGEVLAGSELTLFYEVME